MADIRSCVSEGRGGSRGRGRVSRGTADLSASGPRETWPLCGRACGSVADTRADEAAFHVERAETWFGGPASGWGTAESAKRNGMGRRRGDSRERRTVRRVTRTDGFVGGVREGRRIAGRWDTATVRRVRAGSGARMDGRIGSRGTGCRSAWRRCVNGRADSGARTDGRDVSRGTLPMARRRLAAEAMSTERAPVERSIRVAGSPAPASAAVRNGVTGGRRDTKTRSSRRGADTDVRRRHEDRPERHRRGAHRLCRPRDRPRAVRAPWTRHRALLSRREATPRRPADRGRWPTARSTDRCRRGDWTIGSAQSAALTPRHGADRRRGVARRGRRWAHRRSCRRRS